LFLSQVFGYGISLEELNNEVVREIKQNLPQYSDAEIEIVPQMKDYQHKYFTVDGEDYRIEAKLNSAEDIASTTYVKVIIYEKDTVKNVLRIRYKVKIFAEVLYAKDNYERYLELEPEMFYPKKINVLEYAHQAISKDHDFSGKIFLREVKANKPVFEWMIGKKAVVSLGDIVNVDFYYDNVCISLPAKVLQTGYLDDKIRVQIIKTGKIFNAKIAAKDKFEVRL
jgi:flagella basal body P-ring formation protein FlgA